MSRPEQALMRLVACLGAVIVLCLPAIAETSIPDREGREVDNALFWQAFIPATANSPGRFGAHYKTRVVIFNPTSRDYTITARLYNANGRARQNEIRIDAGEYLVWDNFLEEVFDYRGTGAVWLRADDQDDLFYMTAEVYTDSDNGRFSTTVVSGIIPTFVTSSQPDFNVGINANRNRRTNIGVWNWETRPSSVEAKVFNGSGELLQTIRFDLKANAWQQKNISASVDNGLVRWEINGESKTHYFYAVEVDNQSNDGTLNWSVTGSTGSVDGGGNRAPELHRALRGLTLKVGGSAETVALGDHFSDPNGDRLTYERSITPAGIISTTLVEADLRVRPVAAGTATVTVTARDPGGLEAQGTMEVRVNQDTTTGDPNPGDPRVFDGVEFVWVPPGQFQMGSTSSEADGDERPLTQVRISRGFWMGKYEVTQAQWQAVMGSNPSRFTNCGGDCPVEQVSWEDVQEFIGKLNARSGGRPYRLPTEAEWEYAARAGTTEERHGDLDAIAWYSRNSGGTTHPVGEKAANAWGLHDMIGNVWEWVQDWYGSYPGGSVTDPTGPGSGSGRVLRGGSWIYFARYCRSAFRGRNSPGNRSNTLGFRLVREDGEGGGGGAGQGVLFSEDFESYAVGSWPTDYQFVMGLTGRRAAEQRVESQGGNRHLRMAGRAGSNGEAALAKFFDLPAIAETSIPDREGREVDNALFWQAFIPATANSPGRFGAHYKTRVVIFNPTSRDYTITARLYNANGRARQNEIRIDAGEYLVWDNFLEEVFDYRGTGAVWLRADDQDDLFYMTAEVYTDSDNGRFSTTVVSGIIPTFVTSSQPDFNVGINANRNRRTNIGVWNWETRPSSVEAKVFNGSGELLQTIRFDLKANAWQQKNISASVDNGLVRWEINGESKTHYFYAVEVDNQSNDGTLNWSVTGSTGSVDGGGNRAPELHRALRGLTLQVGGSAETVALGDHFSDPNGDRLTYVRSITPAGIISTTLVDADLRVTPVAAGTATVTVTARDPGGLEAQGRMEVRVNQDTTTGDPNPGDPRVFDGVEFVWVPPGQFQMGSISSAAQEDEQPLTQVRISRGFWMGQVRGDPGPSGSR